MIERRCILKVTAPALLAAFIVSIAFKGIAGAVMPSASQELSASSLAWELPRAAIEAWAGWLVYRRGAGGILLAGLGGVMAFFVDHPIGTSLVFLIMALLGDSSDTLAAIGGVMVSFLMFAPLSFAFGAVGGIIAKVKAPERAADT